MKNIGIITVLSFLFGAFLFSSCSDNSLSARFGNERYEDFVFLDGDAFAVGDSAFFPIMVNYKVEPMAVGQDIVISPAQYYENPTDYEADAKEQLLKQVETHLMIMKELGFNSVRLCMDVMGKNDKGYYFQSKTAVYLKENEERIINAIDDFLLLAKKSGLRVMLLIKPPFDKELKSYTKKLLKHCSENATLFAYDFMNEPLYFDPAKERSKEEALAVVEEWKAMVDKYAPHQLFTIGFSEPIEVFEWDPALLPVDFVQFHTYHPLRVPNEIWWYSNYIGKPWIIGETSFAVDNDSVEYEMQTVFMNEVYQYALNCGASGFGWWEFQDSYNVHFEAEYSGLLNHEGLTFAQDSTLSMVGTLKPAAHNVKKVISFAAQEPWQAVNYYNMLGYSNIVLRGRVLEEKTGKPIEGAVVRGWNSDWTVGINTYSNEKGEFTLYSNDICTHFEISAPCMTKQKFDKELIYNPRDIQDDISNLPNKDLEYHDISYLPFLVNDTLLFHFKPEMFGNYKFEGNMGEVYLKRIKH